MGKGGKFCMEYKRIWGYFFVFLNILLKEERVEEQIDRNT